MKKLIIILLILLPQIRIIAQQGRTIKVKSDIRQVHYEPPRPKLLISNYSCTDENNDTIIDPGEQVKLAFTIENLGLKKAEGVIIKLKITNSPVDTEEFILADTIESILPGEKIEMSLKLTGLTDFKINPVKFNLFAVEKNGFNSIPFEAEIKIGKNSISEEPVIKSNEINNDGNTPGSSSGFKPSDQTIPEKP